MSGGEEWVTTAELALALGVAGGTVGNLVREGVVARPSTVMGRLHADSLGPTAQRRWARSYVNALLCDPPPRIAALLARKRRAEDRDSVGSTELARMLELSANSVVYHLVRDGRLPPSVEGRWSRAAIEAMLLDPPESWVRCQGSNLRVASMRSGSLVGIDAAARACGVRRDDVSDMERTGMMPKRVHQGNSNGGGITMRLGRIPRSAIAHRRLRRSCRQRLPWPTLRSGQTKRWPRATGV